MRAWGFATVLGGDRLVSWSADPAPLLEHEREACEAPLPGVTGPRTLLATTPELPNRASRTPGFRPRPTPADIRQERLAGPERGAGPPGTVGAMHLRMRDVIGAGCLACLLIGLVVLFVIGNIPK